MSDTPGEPQPNGNRMLFLQAALDDELDANALFRIQQQLAEDKDLETEYRRLSVLQQALRKLPKTQANDDFRHRIAGIAAREHSTSRLWPFEVLSGEWRRPALAASLALILGSGLTFLYLPAPGPDIMQELVAGHVRGMIAGQPADIATSDRHTVKPWFATRVTQAPQVFDLSADGFKLDGGRVDVIDDKPVATLVFSHLKHVISVTELPASVAHFGTGENHRNVNGYSVLTWKMGKEIGSNATYVAISDIAPQELDHLAEAFSKAVAAQK